jgi:hypothetical protein
MHGGRLLTLIHFVSWEARWATTLSTLSAVLIVGWLQPTQHLGIHFIARNEANLELHGLANLRGPQPPAGLLPLEAKAEIEPMNA